MLPFRLSTVSLTTQLTECSTISLTANLVRHNANSSSETEGTDGLTLLVKGNSARMARDRN